MLDDITEVYLVPMRDATGCIVCHPSPEALIESLREGTFTLCPEHLLRAHVHGNEEDGVPSLRYFGSIPVVLCDRCGQVQEPDSPPLCPKCGYDRISGRCREEN